MSVATSTHLAGDAFRNYDYVPTADKLQYQNQLNTEVPLSNYFSGNALSLMEQTWGGTSLPFADVLAPYPLFGSVFPDRAGSSSDYDAMHVEVPKRTLASG